MSDLFSEETLRPYISIDIHHSVARQCRTLL